MSRKKGGRGRRRKGGTGGVVFRQDQQKRGAPRPIVRKRKRFFVPRERSVPVPFSSKSGSSGRGTIGSSGGGGLEFEIRGGRVDRRVFKRKFPLGFKSLKEARDLTRRYAELDRKSTVYIRGSSVTGKSFRTGTPFRVEGSRGRKKSDIDVGMVSSKLLGMTDFVSRGQRSFPKRGSVYNKLEYQMERKVGRPMGIAVTTKLPKGPYMVRPHTPLRERRTPVPLPKPLGARGRSGRRKGGGGRGGGGGQLYKI